MASSELSVESTMLDSSTHAEILVLYRESTDSLRFIKNLQWKTVGSTLLVFFGLIAIARMVDATEALANSFRLISVLMTCAVIFTLIIYQFWMYNELKKLAFLERPLSNMFRITRKIKSRREGNLHRYTLLFFMMAVLGLGFIVLHLSLRSLSV